MPNLFSPIQSGTNWEQALATINNNFAQLDNEAVTKTFNGPVGTPTFIQGKLPNNLGTGILMKDTTGAVSIAAYIDANNNPVLKVAKTGKDAVTGSNSDLVFNSAQDVFKIVATDTGTIPSSGTSSSTKTIAHGLSFTPIVMGTVQFGSSFNLCPSIGVSSSTGVITDMTFVSSDATNIYLTRIVPGGTVSSQSVKYYILQESTN